MQKEIRYIDKIKNLKGKRVLLRASLNIPLENGAVSDDFRIERALHTINFLTKQDAKVVVAAHIGRDKEESLRPVHVRLQDFIPVTFVEDTIGDRARHKIEAMQDGDVVMLENLRQHEGETANDFRFAEGLASLADVYVNDAFAASHRKHASLVAVTQFLPSYAGLLFRDELAMLTLARDPEHPALFILGGAKFTTKQKLVEKFLTIYEKVFVGGALANDFYKAQGFETGNSLISDELVQLNALLEHKRLLVPSDVLVTREDGSREVKKPHAVLKNERIVDCGPETIEELKKLVHEAVFVLWNGPLGEYQLGFDEHTKKLISIVAESKTHSIVGGGDTMALIRELKKQTSFTFCSTAGGAMLEFLLEGTLPAIEALEKCNKSIN